MTPFDLESDIRKDLREIKECVKAQSIAIAQLQVKLDLTTKIAAGAITLLSILFPIAVWIFSSWR